MNPTPSKHPLGWLGQEPSFKALTDRAQQLLALQGDLHLCVPAIALTALSLDKGTLVVAASGAAAAAKLRQIEPSVLACLRARGWTLSKIRFRPRPAGSVAPPPAPRPRAPIPEHALAGLAALSEQASDPALREALERLLQRQARQRRPR